MPETAATTTHTNTKGTAGVCVPADPASKGGTEASVRIAKADLVPTEVNLGEEYATFAELEAACEQFGELVNSRPHRVTRRPPVEMLAEERPRLHPVAASPFTVAFGTTRVVPVNTPMVAFEYGQYSVPHQLMGQTVWVRVHGQGADEQVVITHVGADGPVEVARHQRATPRTPKLDDAHFPPAPEGALDRTPKPKTTGEVEFLALGEGARLCLVEAAAAGTSRMRVKMAAAVQLARLFSLGEVDWAPGRLGTPQSTAGSPKPTSSRSWTTAGSSPAPVSTGPARTPPSRRAPAAGLATDSSRTVDR